MFLRQIVRGAAVVMASIVVNPSKRKDYLSWEDYFMSVAFLSAERSKDPKTQVGACIVNPHKRIVGTGYNGMPDGCHDDLMSWKHKAEEEEWLKTKSPYVCHAEMNAILNKNSFDVRNCVMYVTLFPCNECAKMIIQSGIREVVYASSRPGKNEETAARLLFQQVNMNLREFKPQKDFVTIDLTKRGTTPVQATEADDVSAPPSV